VVEEEATVMLVLVLVLYPHSEITVRVTVVALGVTELYWCTAVVVLVPLIATDGSPKA